jgi:hypothetical protein
VNKVLEDGSREPVLNPEDQKLILDLLFISYGFSCG